MNRIAAGLITIGMVLALSGPATAVELATGLLYSRGGQSVHCCTVNTTNQASTLEDIVLYNGQNYVHSTVWAGLTPATLPPQQGRCVLFTVDPGHYRCVFIHPGAKAESVRADMAIAEPNGTILSALDAHPLPERPPCGSATAPQCDGDCPFGSGWCTSTSSGSCSCQIP